MKRVLVTRPRGQHEKLCQLLRQAGFEPCHQPLLELEACGESDPALRQMVLDLDLYEHIIFISTNAVGYALRRFDDFWPQLPVGINWYAVGPASAAALAERGLPVLSPSEQMNSEGLLAMAELTNVRDQRVLLVRGEGGRTRLRDTLLERGARLDELVCYRRYCPQLPEGKLAHLLKDCQAVVVSSGDALKNMRKLLGAGERQGDGDGEGEGKQSEIANFGDLPLVVPSRRVADFASQMGFHRVLVAENATDEAAVKTLVESEF